MIITNLTEDGSTDVLLSTGGSFAVTVQGTFDTGTVTLEISADGTTFHAAKDVNGDNAALTADGTILFDLGGGHSYRATLSSAGAGTDVDVYFLPARQY